MAPIPLKREKRIVGTSLKMYFNLPSTLRYIDSVAALSSVADKANIDLFVIPDFISVLPSKEKLDKINVWLGAQDCYSEDSGAFTGEVGPLTLRQAGVKIVEIGHAERRRYFRETDEDVAKKARAIVRNDMAPWSALERLRNVTLLQKQWVSSLANASLRLMPLCPLYQTTQR